MICCSTEYADYTEKDTYLAHPVTTGSLAGIDLQMQLFTISSESFHSMNSSKHLSGHRNGFLLHVLLLSAV
jgi:hypothetical protein